MGIFDDIRAKGAAYRLTEEDLYAEALREIEAGQRRDGLWAKAMSESDMDQGRAGAKYIKLRVQSLRDEVTVLIAQLNSGEKKIAVSYETPTRSSIGAFRRAWLMFIFGLACLFIFGVLPYQLITGKGEWYMLLISVVWISAGHYAYTTLFPRKQ